MHSLYVVGLNFYLQSAKRKWSLTSCTKCYSAHHSARGESVEDEVCQELLVYIPERPQNIQLSRPITAIEGPLSVLNSLCNTGNNTHCLWGRDAGKCYGWCGGQSQYPRENCYLRQLPSTFIGKSRDDATN